PGHPRLAQPDTWMPGTRLNKLGHEVERAGRSSSPVRDAAAERREDDEIRGDRGFADLFHREQLDIEHQRRVWRDHPACAARAIAERGRNDECALAADLHRGDALVPAGDDLALTDRKLERFVAIDGRVEFLAFLPIFIEPARVVHHAGLARL